MPHFVIDCSKPVLSKISPNELIQNVYVSAESTALFSEGDIKVRVQAFEHYTIGNSDDNFIHVFAYIMEGRTTEQKKNLSAKIISELKKVVPEIPIISINIRDFEKATYCNKTMV